MPIIIVLMAPKSGIISYKAIETDTNSFVKPPQKFNSCGKTGMDTSFRIILGAIGTLYCVYEFMNGHSLDLNIINLFSCHLVCSYMVLLVTLHKDSKNLRNPFLQLSYSFHFMQGLLLF